MNEQMTVRATRAGNEKTNKTSPLHIPSFRWLPPKGELQRRKDEGMTNNERGEGGGTLRLRGGLN